MTAAMLIGFEELELGSKSQQKCEVSFLAPCNAMPCRVSVGLEMVHYSIEFGVRMAYQKLTWNEKDPIVALMLNPLSLMQVSMESFEVYYFLFDRLKAAISRLLSVSPSVPRYFSISSLR